MKSPCEACNRIKRFFCLIECAAAYEHRTYFPKTVESVEAVEAVVRNIDTEDLQEGDAIFLTDNPDKGLVTLTICAEHTLDIRTGICPYCQIDKIMAANESLSDRILSLVEDLDLYKKAEQFGRQENARLLAALLEHKEELKASCVKVQLLQMNNEKQREENEDLRSQFWTEAKCNVETYDIMKARLAAADKEIEQLSRDRHNESRNVVILKSFLESIFGVVEEDYIGYPKLIPVGEDKTLYDELQEMEEILDEDQPMTASEVVRRQDAGLVYWDKDEKTLNIHVPDVTIHHTVKKLYLNGTEEGDICGRNGCLGELHFAPVDNCSCHISPPCNQCVTNPLTCPECGWQQGDDELPDEKLTQCGCTVYRHASIQ